MKQHDPESEGMGTEECAAAGCEICLEWLKDQADDRDLQDRLDERRSNGRILI